MLQAARQIASNARAGEASAPGRLFDKAPFSASRYPHLQAVFERMVRASIDSLREVCPVPPQFDFKEVQAETLASVLGAFERRGIAAVFAVPEWDARLLFLVDRGFVYAMTELLCGGDGTEPAFEGIRRFSVIETSIAKTVLGIAAKMLETALAPTTSLTLHFERIETNMALAAIDDRNDQAVVAKFELRALGRTGRLQIVIPRSVVRSARSRRGDAAGAAGPQASDWSRRMQDEISSTDVTLQAVLEERRVTLAEVAALRVGQLLQLQASVDSRIKLGCDGRALFLCEIGQSEGVYTLRVDDVIEPQEKSP